MPRLERLSKLAGGGVGARVSTIIPYSDRHDAIAGSRMELTATPCSRQRAGAPRVRGSSCAIMETFDRRDSGFGGGGREDCGDVDDAGVVRARGGGRRPVSAAPGRVGEEEEVVVVVIVVVVREVVGVTEGLCEDGWVRVFVVVGGRRRRCSVCDVRMVRSVSEWHRALAYASFTHVAMCDNALGFVRAILVSTIRLASSCRLGRVG